MCFWNKPTEQERVSKRTGISQTDAKQGYLKTSRSRLSLLPMPGHIDHAGVSQSQPNCVVGGSAPRSFALRPAFSVRTLCRYMARHFVQAIVQSAAAPGASCEQFLKVSSAAVQHTAGTAEIPQRRTPFHCRPGSCSRQKARSVMT